VRSSVSQMQPSMRRPGLDNRRPCDNISNTTPCLIRKKESGVVTGGEQFRRCHDRSIQNICAWKHAVCVTSTSVHAAFTNSFSQRATETCMGSKYRAEKICSACVCGASSITRWRCYKTTISYNKEISLDATLRNQLSGLIMYQPFTDVVKQDRQE
jgi:hypothetical protein